MFSKTVWKYRLEVADEQVVEMPANARILTVQAQFDEPCLWALVDPDLTAMDRRTILITGTGHRREDLASHVNYLGTLQIAMGLHVFHVFEDVSRCELATASALVEEAVPV